MRPNSKWTGMVFMTGTPLDTAAAQATHGKRKRKTKTKHTAHNIHKDLTTNHDDKKDTTRQTNLFEHQFQQTAEETHTSRPQDEKRTKQARKRGR